LVTLVALPRFHYTLGVLPDISAERPADVVGLFETPLVIASDISFVAGVRLYKFAFSCHLHFLQLELAPKLGRR
jgi:hypothetical protein